MEAPPRAEPPVVPATPPTETPAVPTAAKVPELAEAGTGLSAGFSEYHRLMRTAPAAPLSLAALLEGGPSAAPVVAAPIPELAPAAQAEVIAPITDYCFSGAAALERAMRLQSEVRKAMAEGPSPALHDLIEEVFDLVKLGSQQPG